MVLIVEDEAISRRALAALLRLHGYETRAAGSAEEALLLLAAGSQPHMALVDINLPGMNGVEFVRRLHQTHPGVSCVLMTANQEAGNMRLSESVAEPTLHKPFELGALLHLIHESPRSLPMGPQA